MKRLCWTLIALLPALPLSAADVPEKLLETLWTQTAVEWQALSLQAFHAARVAMDRALKDRNWSAALEQTGNYKRLPPAVILDVDETVLDNSAAQARQVLAGSGFDPVAWNRWVLEASAPAMPGAVEFCRYAASRKVSIFYITNREASQEQATRENLRRHGFPLDPSPDAVMCLNEQPAWGSDKTTRRAYVAARHRIVLLVGDDLNDFLAGVKSRIEIRHQKAKPYQSWWGTRWIVLPNPIYGSWEAALYLPDKPNSPQEKRARELNLLKTN